MTRLLVNTPVTDLRHNRDGRLDSQLLFGEPFEVEQTDGPYSFGTTECGYSGWVASESLSTLPEPTHHVCALATFIHIEPNLKSQSLDRLSFGSKLCVTGTSGDYSQVESGYIYTPHLSTTTPNDYIYEAEKFLHTPYLWGGRSSIGLDCSALVQLSFAAVGITSPRDTGDQQTTIGSALPSNTPLLRGDLVFWKGHVGILQNATTILHANAHHMCVFSEPLATVTARASQCGDGDITAIRRILDIG